MGWTYIFGGFTPIAAGGELSLSTIFLVVETNVSHLVPVMENVVPNCDINAKG